MSYCVGCARYRRAGGKPNLPQLPEMRSAAKVIRKKCPARRRGKKVNRNEYHNDWPRCAQ
jgi:hypothetical protein